LRNLNILGNPLDFSKVYELYLKEIKFLKTFNNQPLNKKTKAPNDSETNLKRGRLAGDDTKENETKNSKIVKTGEISNIYRNEKEKNPKNANNIQKTKISINEETKAKLEKIEENTQKIKNSSEKPTEKETLPPLNQKNPIQKITKKKTRKMLQNNEKIKDLLSHGDEKISQWDN